jgi:tRNA(Ile)-lysidine synthetase-like protein
MRLQPAEFKILQHLRANHVFKTERSDIHLMLSGGKDSVSLLEILSSIVNLPREWSRLNVHLQLHHFNHKRRGIESDLDEELCIDIAKKLGHPIHLHEWSEDLERQLDCGANFQNIARTWRYNTVRSQAQKLSHGRDWVIATAHHRRDHAESVLMNLARGCGPDGLLGMVPWNPLTRLLRPFLWLDADTSDHAIENKKLPHREDSSNLSINYARNKIRHTVIPGLIDINSKFIEHVWMLSSDLQLSTEQKKSLADTEDFRFHATISTALVQNASTLHQFITKATLGSDVRLTREKLNNAILHMRKAIAKSSSGQRYNFALSEQFELVITAEITEIRPIS